jgi:accessory colonization factor AcfC
MPTLLSLLKFHESSKGSKLTEEEVLEIRDNAVVMTVSSSTLRKIEEDRGYKDIDPNNCWVEWNKCINQQDKDKL